MSSMIFVMGEKEVSSWDKSVEFVKNNRLFTCLIVIGLLLISYGMYEYIKPQKSSLEFVSTVQDIKGEEIVPEAKSVSIDIQGSVEKPGVYQLPKDSRIQDALNSAGGMSSDADFEFVSKRINLAQKLVDGQKIYIPSTGEEITSGFITQISDTVSSEITSGLIGINSSSQSKLEELPRIGPVTAQKIISGRPYGDISELVSKNILGQKTYDAIKDLIDLN